MEPLTLFLPHLSRSPCDLRRAFHVKISSVNRFIVRFGARYASVSLGGGFAAEIFSAKDVDGRLIRTCSKGRTAQRFEDVCNFKQSVNFLKCK